MHIIEYCKIEVVNNRELWVFSFMKQKPVYLNQKPAASDIKKYYNIDDFKFVEVDVSVMENIIKDNEIDKRNSYKFIAINIFKKYKAYCITGLILLLLFFITILDSIDVKEEVIEPEIHTVENIVQISKQDINKMDDKQLNDFLNKNIETQSEKIESVTFKDLSGKEYEGEYLAGAYIVEATVLDKENNSNTEKFVVSVSDSDSDGDKIYDENDENPDINDTIDSDGDGVLDKIDKYPDKNDLDKAKEEGKNEAKKEQEKSEPVQVEPIQAAPVENTEAYEPETYYENCTAVKEASAAPIYSGDPGYGSHLDRDGDGVACE